MAYVVVEDEAAAIELLCFSRTIDQCGSYMAVNTPVVVKGRLSVRDEKPPQIMCDTIYPLNTENLPPVAAKPPGAEKRRPFPARSQSGQRGVPPYPSGDDHVRGGIAGEDPPCRYGKADGGQMPVPPRAAGGMPPMAGRCQCGGAGTARLTNGRIFRMINEEGSVIA